MYLSDDSCFRALVTATLYYLCRGNFTHKNEEFHQPQNYYYRVSEHPECTSLGYRDDSGKNFYWLSSICSQLPLAICLQLLWGLALVLLKKKRITRFHLKGALYLSFPTRHFFANLCSLVSFVELDPGHTKKK